MIATLAVTFIVGVIAGIVYSRKKSPLLTILSIIIVIMILWGLPLLITNIVRNVGIDETESIFERIEEADYKDVSEAVMLCEKLGSSYSKGKCFNVLAQNEKDIALCGNAATEKENCVREIIYYFQGDISLCNLISDISDEILLFRCGGFAVDKNKEGIDLCIKANHSSVRDGCYYTLAFNKSDKEICSLIEGDWNREQCLKYIE